MPLDPSKATLCYSYHTYYVELFKKIQNWKSMGRLTVPEILLVTSSLLAG